MYLMRLLFLSGVASTYGVICLLATLYLILFPVVGMAESRYIRKNEELKSVIVFVHGFWGSADTWRSDKAYWPELMLQDESFDNASLFVLDYPTSIFEKMSIDEVAESIRVDIRGHDVDKHESLVFLVHSMGGLVTRSFLLKNRAIAEKTAMIFFYATPTTGSEIADLAKLVICNQQLKKMCVMEDDSYLADQVRAWSSAKIDIASYGAYEKQKMKGLIVVVPMASAAILTNKELTPLEYNHTDIVKPDSQSDRRNMVFRTAFQDQMERWEEIKNRSLGMPK